MLKEIRIKNFRSIEEAEVTLAPITVLYGPTSSGKSSLLYALLVLRNFIINPNRQPDGFFNLGFMDLGGFEACIFNHDIRRTLGISMEYTNGPEQTSYGLSFNKTDGHVKETVGKFEMEGAINLPYALNQTFPFAITHQNGEEYTVNWNGIACSIVPKKPTAETQKQAQEFATLLNMPSEILKAIDIAPHKRGFYKPNYTPVSPSPTPTTEDEVASIIINDQYLPGRISAYTTQIFNRDFRTHVIPGTASFFLQSTDNKSRIPVQLVNDGFGVNQVIYILTKMLRVDVSTLLLEEPEVHLHPEIIRNFANALSTFINSEERKQVICTTHSEQFLVALLVAVAGGLLKPEDIQCYLVTKEKRSTNFKKQEVNNNGQIEGGLTSFMEAQVEDLKRFLGDKKKNG